MFKHRLLILVVGGFVALGILEFGLGLYAEKAVPKQAKEREIISSGRSNKSVKSEKSDNKAKIKILCLGDSFTYGLGASSMMSFPEQIKGMFEKEYGTNLVEVTNGGVIAYNTSQVRKKFEELLAQSTFDYVVILAGGANEWNFIGHDYYTERYGSTLGKIGRTAKKFLVSTNSYKILCLLSPKLGQGESVSIAQVAKVQPVQQILPENEAVTAHNFIKSKGFVLAGNGDYAQAIAWLNTKLSAEPTNSFHHLGLAYSYYLMKEYGKSEEMARKGLMIDASNPFLYTALGYVFIEHKKVVEALDMFARSEEILPGNKYNIDGINKIVNFASIDQGLLKGVDNELSIERIAKNPQLKSDFIRLISYYVSLQDYAKVSSTYTEYLLKFPENAEAMQRYAQFLFEQRKYEESRNWYHKAIKLAPKVSTAYIALGQTYLAEGKIDQVLVWYKKAISVDPDILDNYCKLVELINMSKKGDFELNKDEILAFINQFVEKSDNAKSYYGMIEQLWNDDTINEWIATDLIALVQMAKEHAVKPILQSYPHHSESNDIAEYLAENNQTIFVDQAENFESLIQSGVARNDLFAGDGHCNDQGYQIMATNLYQKIISDEYFQHQISL